MKSKLHRKSVKSSQEIARKSGRYSSTTEANRAGKKSAMEVHEAIGKFSPKRSGLKKHPPKKYGLGRMMPKHMRDE